MPAISETRKPTLTTTLVLGATGKTGLPLVEQLLRKKHKVRVVVRSSHKLSAEILENPNAKVIEAGVLDLSDEEMAAHVKGCNAVVSCLGSARPQPVVGKSGWYGKWDISRSCVHK